jgi:hypothetical protein
VAIRDRSSPRDGYAVRVLAVHTSEGFDKPVVDDAAALRDATWWVGSSHAIADNDPGTLLTPAQGCVPYERASWTLRSGNRWSENIELIAQAGWTRAEWLARPKLLDNCAHWLADRSKVRNIPLVKLTPQQYRAGGSGVIGHHDHTVGYSDGTHWDPGPAFPWDVVLASANAYRNGTTEENDMTPGQALLLEQIHSVLFAGSKETPRDLTVYQRVVRTEAVTKDIQLALTSALPILITEAQEDGDPAAFAAAVAAAIPADIAQDVLDLLVARLAAAPAAT